MRKPNPKLRLYEVEVTFRVRVPAESSQEARDKAQHVLTSYDADVPQGLELVSESWQTKRPLVAGGWDEAAAMALEGHREGWGSYDDLESYFDATDDADEQPS